MKVLLLSDVKGVGRQGQVKVVSDGYALNHLIPQRLVEPVTKSNQERILKVQKDQEEVIRKLRESAKSMAKGTDGVSVEIEANKNESGHLFAAVSREEISLKIKEKTGMTVEPENIIIEKPIKEVGTHEVDVDFGEYKAKIEVKVI